MTDSFKLKFREWLTADEAAQLLAQMVDQPVSTADILRLGLDGHVPLSVFLPPGTTALCWNLHENTPPADGRDGDDPTGVGIIDGVWDLPMVPPGRLEIENQFNELRALPKLSLEGLTGAVVEQPGIYCRLRAEGAKYSSPPSVLPAGSSVVVRTPAIIQFASTLLKPDPLQKPLGESERTTLLIIIAALADKAGIDRSKPYGKDTTETIATATQLLGAPLSEKTIGNYLALIPAAIEERSE